MHFPDIKKTMSRIDSGIYFPDGERSDVTIVLEERTVLGSTSAVHFATVHNSRSGEQLRVAVKTPKLDGPDASMSGSEYTKQQLHAESIQRRSAQYPRQLGVWGTFCDDEVVRLDLQTVREKTEQLQLVLFLEAAIPEQAIQLLELLAKLGLKTIQNERSFSATATAEAISIKQLETYYIKIIEWLIAVHTSDEVLPQVSQQEYEQALTNIVVDPARFDGIRSTGLGQELPQEQLDDIRKKMLQLAQKLALVFSHRLKPVHGDAWASNFFIDQELEEVFGIDPGSVGESDPALDLAFALMDLVMIDFKINVNTGDEELFTGEHVALADRMLALYKETTQDAEIEYVLPLFVAFKLFVSATFDLAGKPIEQRALLDTISGMLAQSLASDVSGFSFNCLEQYRSSTNIVASQS